MTTHNRKLFVLTILLVLMMAACSPAAEEEVGGLSPFSANEGPERIVSDSEPIEEIEEEEAAEEMEEAIYEESYDEAIAPVPAEAPEEPAVSEPESTEFFQDYGTNPFVSTAEDNLSTFAVDVDSGSYTVARNYLDEGLRPPAEAVRLEEFVNYFEQDYPLPQQNAFGIYTDGAPTPFSSDGNYVVRVGVQGFDVPANERPDANLVFVIDVSGSMEGPDRLDAVKSSLNTLVNELRPNDSVAIVVYGSEGRVLLEPTEVRRQGQITQAINSVRSEGSTNAEEGLQIAYQLATANFDETRINRIILCSDGVANVGATGPDTILEIVRQQADEGITLTTVGFGMGNFNDTLMEQLANDGDGQYFYVDSPQEAQRLFVEDLTGTLQTIARDAKIQVEFNSQTVQYYRLMGYENRDVADSDFRNNEVDAGEIGSGHSVTALYEIVPYGQASGDLANVYMRWEDPETGFVTEINHAVTTVDIAPQFGQASARYQQDVAVAAFADILSNGAWSQTANLFEVYEILEGVAKEVDDPDVSELLILIERAQ